MFRFILVFLLFYSVVTYSDEYLDKANEALQEAYNLTSKIQDKVVRGIFQNALSNINEDIMHNDEMNFLIAITIIGKYDPKENPLYPQIKDNINKAWAYQRLASSN